MDIKTAGNLIIILAFVLILVNYICAVVRLNEERKLNASLIESIHKLTIQIQKSE